MVRVATLVLTPPAVDCSRIAARPHQGWHLASVISLPYSQVSHAPLPRSI